MFTGISRQSYLLITGASSAIYYFYVAVRYYRDDLAAWLTNKASNRTSHKNATSSSTPSESQQAEIIPNKQETAESAESDYDELEHLIGRVQKTIADAATRSAKPDEVKGYLSLAFKEYPSLKNDGMRPAINELVASQSAPNKISP
jgi:hypothetical protein